MINRFVFTTLFSCLFSFALPLHSQDTKVVEVSLAAEPQNYGGPCPVKIRFTGWILTSGPGPVSFQFERSDSWVGEVRTEEVILKTNRLEVSTEWDFEGPADQYDGWVALHTLKPNEVISDKAAFSIGCSNGTGNAEEAKQPAWEESQKAPPGGSATAEEERRTIEKAKPSEQFIPCPLDEVQTQVVTALPQPWWITPQIGKLVGTQIDTVGGKRTLICNYWAYARSVPVMREFPAGTNCRAADNGFYCWEELQQPSAEEEKKRALGKFDSNPGSACMNWRFEDGLKCWHASGGAAFGNQPVDGNTVVSERVLTKMWYSSGGIGGDYWKGTPYPIGIKGRYWIGTHENGSGDAPTGSLTSEPIVANKRFELQME